MSEKTKTPTCPTRITDELAADRRGPDAAATSRKIAVAGKGGTGKTTLAGTLARTLARRGHPVWAVDADSNPNLGLTLGLPRERVAELRGLPRTLLEERYDDQGKRSLYLGLSPAEVARAHGTPAPDGITLLLMGTIDHAGAG